MSSATAYARHQPFVDLPDQRFGDRLAAAQILRNQVERLAVIQQFAHVIVVRTFHCFACPQAGCFVERELRAFDVRGVMRFQQQRALAHAYDPIFRKRSRLQESPRAFDRGKRRRDGVGDREAGVEGHGYSSPRKARDWKEQNSASRFLNPAN